MAQTYTVKIVYSGVAAPEDIRFASPISPLYCPTNSYIHTDAYEGTVYDTDVKGMGSIAPVEPYASTAFPFPVSMAQFKLATVGTDVIGEDGVATGAKEVTFEVDNYAEAFWYMQAGEELADQGFTVTVTAA